MRFLTEFYNKILVIFITILAVNASAIQYGPVKSIETIESIATVFSSQSSHTISQWIIAFWEGNPDAFEQKNIYGLRSDTLLNIPTHEQISATSPEAAQRIIDEHAKAWQAQFNFDEIADIDISPAAIPANAAYTEPAVEIQPTATMSTPMVPTDTRTLGLQRVVKISAEIFSKRNIPFVIISMGCTILALVLRFALGSARQEQKAQIERMRDINLQPIRDPFANEQAESVPIDRQEENGDYNIFAAPEGVNIKLDLAQAYINMHDMEGARSILRDIIANHHGQAAQQAKALLSKMEQAEILHAIPTPG